MAITYPYKYRNYTIYEGDIGPGIKDKYSLVLVLEDSVTYGPPIGRVSVRFKEIKRKPFKNLSGLFCFKGVPDGSYTLDIESDHYKPASKNITISSNQDPMIKNDVKIETIQLIPKLSYSSSGIVPIYLQIIDKDNQPLKNENIIGRISTPACYLKRIYNGLLNDHSAHKIILEKYAENIESKICIYPDRITQIDRQRLGDLYTELVQHSRQKLRGLLNFSYSEYEVFLKDNLLKEDLLTKYEKDNGHKVCLKPAKISETDKQKIDSQALKELNEMATLSGSGAACFTHKKYIVFLKKYILEDKTLTNYAEDIDGRIRINLANISKDDLQTFTDNIINKLKEKAEVRTKTDENGECVLYFRGLINKTEKILILTKKAGIEKPEYIDLIEASINNRKIIYT